MVIVAAHSNADPAPEVDGLRRWRVAAGLMELDGHLLLVENLRRNGRTDWSTPGGVVEHGEDPVDGLTREVVEETGLTVTEWSGPTYTVETKAHDMGWHLSVDVFTAVSWTGDVKTGDDPDGIVVAARFVHPDECGALLDGAGRWVAEPVLEWLAERWEGTRAFQFSLHGADRSALRVERH
jgi:8-oxo-dGTP diphosphatase